ncbi:hypothetical protein C1H76_4662 [Elsinoe australis]|uniref:Uncharacterized protein n=1 Tax=Elsinoe australis TaxID=40998 RepID=A0A4U7B4R6_9PEZI|nr:hypothetical protein C1H76_4662 [Elsinoe australis]
MASSMPAAPGPISHLPMNGIPYLALPPEIRNNIHSHFWSAMHPPSSLHITYSPALTRNTAKYHWVPTRIDPATSAVLALAQTCTQLRAELIPYTSTLPKVTFSMDQLIDPSALTMHVAHALEWRAVTRLEVVHYDGPSVVDMLWWIMGEMEWGANLTEFSVRALRVKGWFGKGHLERGIKDQEYLGSLVGLWARIKTRVPIRVEVDWDCRRFERELKDAERKRFWGVWLSLSEEERRKVEERWVFVW